MSLPASQRTSVSWIETEPEGGPLDDPSDPDELLDEEELELLELEEEDEDELDDDELDEESELEELDSDELLSTDELVPQHPSPRTSTSHLQLSANRLAMPNVPAGTEFALSQPHPLPEVAALHRSGQTTPTESQTVNVSGTGHHLPALYSTSCAVAEPQRDSAVNSLNRQWSS